MATYTLTPDTTSGASGNVYGTVTNVQTLDGTTLGVGNPPSGGASSVIINFTDLPSLPSNETIAGIVVHVKGHQGSGQFYVTRSGADYGSSKGVAGGDAAYTIAPVSPDWNTEGEVNSIGVRMSWTGGTRQTLDQAYVVVTTTVAAPVNTVAPTISGTIRRRNSPSCNSGTWSNIPTSYTYQWKRNGVAISGATSSSYTIVDADVGSTLTCTVTASNDGGSASATSAATSVVLGYAGCMSV